MKKPVLAQGTGGAVMGIRTPNLPLTRRLLYR